MNDVEALRNLVLAPYIIKATALIRVRRKVGGNQFRHSFSTLGILLDYKFYSDSVLLNRDWINAKIFQQMNVIDIDPSEPYAANSLFLGKEVLLSSAFPATRQRLETAGIPVKTVDLSETGIGIKMTGYLPFDTNDTVDILVKELDIEKKALVMWTKKFYGISRAGLQFS